MKKYMAIILLASCGDFVDTSVVTVGKAGPQGVQGEVGPRGEKGDSGASCDVTELIASPLTPNGGALIECATTSVVVHNGATGATGSAGADGQDAVLPPMSISHVIDPCGKQGAFDEVLFKMQNNKLYALYYAPPNSFLTELPNGAFRTTDGTSCNFTVLNGNVTSSPAAVVQ